MYKRYYYDSFDMPDDYFSIPNDEQYTDEYIKKKEKFKIHFNKLIDAMELKKRNTIKVLNPFRVDKLNSIIHNAYTLTKTWFGDICIEYDEDEYTFHIDIIIETLHISDANEKDTLTELIDDSDSIGFATDYESGKLLIMVDISVVYVLEKDDIQ